MKKVISILFSLMILLSGVTVNMAFHYCGGSLAAKKITLSGELAGCGMEEHQHSSGGFASLPCCSNVTSSFTFNNTFVSSQVLSDYNGKVIAGPNEAPVAGTTIVFPELPGPSFTSRPPGNERLSEVALEFICIFRI